MALIQCRECGKEVSDQAKMCPNCGCPVKMEETSIMIKASLRSSGWACAYIIYDENGTEIGKIKPGESFSRKLPDKDVVYGVKLRGAFVGPKELPCKAHTKNRFSVAPSTTGMTCNVSKVDLFDAD